MPKTKFQRIIFTLMMVFFMVYSMTVYTISLSSGQLTGEVFIAAFKEMWTEYLIVFALIFFLITNMSIKLAGKVADSETNRFKYMIAIQSFTVLLIVPLITFCVSLLKDGISANLLTQWITTAAICYPAAYFLQIFIVGPLVRFLFRMMFRRQLAA
ncbi:MAG: DUF2798 domain-containing protein [Anaerovoracaceae bacterium]|jgi:hypothetical protein